MYRNKTFKLIQVYYEQVTPAWDIIKLHFPQECSEMKNRDMPSTLNYLHTSSEGLKTQTGTFAVGTDVISGISNHFIGIDNNLMHKEMNSTNSNSKSLEFLHGNCSKCDLSVVFSLQGTGGSPTGPEPENRVEAQVGQFLRGTSAQ